MNRTAHAWEDIISCARKAHYPVPDVSAGGRATIPGEQGTMSLVSAALDDYRRQDKPLTYYGVRQMFRWVVARATETAIHNWGPGSSISDISFAKYPELSPEEMEALDEAPLPHLLTDGDSAAEDFFFCFCDWVRKGVPSASGYRLDIAKELLETLSWVYRICYTASIAAL